MTVKYADSIASQSGFGSIVKLLFRWRGSVYKMIWQDMLVYFILYYVISLVYRFGLSDHSKLTFETLVLSCSHFRNSIPVSFVLGFYISLVVNRWWSTYQSLPRPDNAAMLVTSYIRGEDPEGRIIRNTILRYVNLSILMTLRMISPVVKTKYPSLKSFVEEGYLTDTELTILETHEQHTKVHKVYVPFMWSCRLLAKAGLDGRITSDAIQRMIADEILKVKGKCGEMIGWYDYNIPLVYTQVVTIAVYSFYCISLIGEQILDPGRGYPGHQVDLYVPIFGILQLLVYIGWIKVAEALLNPFGNDDHDFEFIPFLARHLAMTRLLGDPSEDELPPQVREVTLSP